MQIEEIDVLIEKNQREVDILMDQRRKYMANKMWTKKTKSKKIYPIDQAIHEVRVKI